MSWLWPRWPTCPSLFLPCTRSLPGPVGTPNSLKHSFLPPGMCPGLIPTPLGASLQGHLCPRSAPTWLAGCMFPSCLPLLFNAKVLAKDIFLLLLFQHSVLHCGLALLPQPWAMSPGQAHSWLKASGGSRKAGLLSLFMGLAKESSICALKIILLK